MSLGEDGWNGEPRCEKQRLEEPPGSGDPLHLIFEEYADDQVTLPMLSLDDEIWLGIELMVRPLG